MKHGFHPIDRELAETIGLQAIGYLASDPARLTSFLSETGMTLDVLHAQAGEAHVLAAALDALLHNEPELLTFAANAGIETSDIVRAHAALDPSARYLRST